MIGFLIVLLAGVLVAGCGESSETSLGALIVRERLLRDAPLPVEGSRSFATLKPTNGGQPVERERPGLGPGTSQILLEQRLEPGEYRLSSWIRTCGGTCDFLGGPRDRCETELKVRADERLVAVITRSNEGPCEIKLSSPSEDEAKHTAEDLWDRTFISVAVRENGVPRPLVQDTHISVTFGKEKGRSGVSWRAGCNSAGADVEITADRLLLGHIASTLIGCSDELNEQDEWLLDFFRSDPKWRLSDDGLVLSSDATVIELEGKAPQTESG